MTLLIVFVAGYFIGAFCGVLVVALCVAGADERQGVTDG